MKKTSARLDAIRLGVPQLSAPEKPVDIRIKESFSAIPWLDRLLQRMNFGPRLSLLLRQADLKWTVGKMVMLSIFVGLAAGYLVDLRSGAVVLALLIAILAGSCPLMYILRSRRRRFDRIRSLLPDAIDLMVAAIPRRSQPQFRHGYELAGVPRAGPRRVPAML